MSEQLKPHPVKWSSEHDRMIEEMKGTTVFRPSTGYVVRVAIEELYKRLCIEQPHESRERDITLPVKCSQGLQGNTRRFPLSAVQNPSPIVRGKRTA